MLYLNIYYKLCRNKKFFLFYFGNIKMFVVNYDIFLNKFDWVLKILRWIEDLYGIFDILN